MASEAKEESCLIGVRFSSEQKKRERDFTSALFFLVAVKRGEFLGPLVPGGNLFPHCGHMPAIWIYHRPQLTYHGQGARVRIEVFAVSSHSVRDDSRRMVATRELPIKGGLGSAQGVAISALQGIRILGE